MGELERVVAVDDELRGAELVRRALRGALEVEVFTSGREAWESVQRGGVSLVVADQRMPDMSGVELLTRVAELYEPIGRILITAYADRNAAIDAINAARVHAFLTKPCAPDEVRRSALEVLARLAPWRRNAQVLEELADASRRLRATLRAMGGDPAGAGPSGAMGD